MFVAYVRLSLSRYYPIINCMSTTFFAFYAIL
nr:MAG TPA: hypothetical protein [Caudoviricetes sp.]